MEHKRVVITCFGAITPIGDSHEMISKNLREGKSGIKRIEKFSTESFRSHYAGIPDQGNDHIKWPRQNPIVGEEYYALQAVKNLVSHEQFPRGLYREENMGCFIGTDEPSLDISQLFDMADKQLLLKEKYLTLEQYFIDHLLINDYLRYDPTIVLREIHKHIYFTGPAWCHMGLCSASLQAMGAGFHAVRSGRVEAAIVGGVSGKVVPTHLALLEAVGVIAMNSELVGQQSSRPFDTRRNGYVPAEGGILFLIETLDKALESNRKPLLEICGYGSALNGQHIVKPHLQEEDMISSMQVALGDARLDKSNINYVNAHGTSTVLNDYHESRAINTVLNNDVRVTANKSIHGHLIAAAGAMEILNILVSSRDGYIAPTINLDQQDHGCEVNMVTNAEPFQGGYILKNSFGMGGLSSSMVLRG